VIRKQLRSEFPLPCRLVRKLVLFSDLRKNVNRDGPEGIVSHEFNTMAIGILYEQFFHRLTIRPQDAILDMNSIQKKTIVLMVWYCLLKQ